ncbi:OmpA family protein [Hydrogenophaga sp. PAMC20947]|uniref:OmpA family protein n=1 Tax=Hydrogenophaga sp. PAMC20947 TaxID=2565558 RepID=UPI00109DF832|nr:OmpA family protein [Hydrogenophaga sp. PAMC20947]QCB46011.1 OmpA family protein [Hydrogenophaga sp. PAMC20947]
MPFTYLFSRTPYLALATLVLSLAACAPASRVTLLPQGNGQPSAVMVTTSQGAQIVDQPYQVAEIKRDGALSLDQTSADEVRKTHPQLLALQPAAPESFVLEFEPGSSTLTAESQARLPEVIARAQARAGGEIVVTGHTDRQGALEANDKLSLERAQAVRDLMVERGFKGELIEAVGRGEREPAVPTDDEVVEPRNRRAVVVVR